MYKCQLKKLIKVNYIPTQKEVYKKLFPLLTSIQIYKMIKKNIVKLYHSKLKEYVPFKYYRKNDPAYVVEFHRICDYDYDIIINAINSITCKYNIACHYEQDCIDHLHGKNPPNYCLQNSVLIHNYLLKNDKLILKDYNNYEPLFENIYSENIIKACKLIKNTSLISLNTYPIYAVKYFIENKKIVFYNFCSMVDIKLAIVKFLEKIVNPLNNFTSSEINHMFKCIFLNNDKVLYNLYILYNCVYYYIYAHCSYYEELFSDNLILYINNLINYIDNNLICRFNQKMFDDTSFCFKKKISYNDEFVLQSDNKIKHETIMYDIERILNPDKYIKYYFIKACILFAKNI
jgi:hypothetical protein